MAQDLPRTVVMTGATAGIGWDAAQRMAKEPDTTVLIGARGTGRTVPSGCEQLPLDLMSLDTVRTFADAVRERLGDKKIDALVLNASGGLERGAAGDFAMAINRDAQLHLVQNALPHLHSGSRIVYVTSHQAHFHGRKPVPEDYEPIAASKRAGEDALRSLIPEFATRGIGFTVISGDMIEGTMIVRLLRRRDPRAVDARTAQGQLPTVEQFATAVADATATPTEPGHTVYVGGADYLVHP